MASSAYRDAPASHARAVVPVRTRRRRHLFAIAAAAASVIAIAGDSLIGVVCGLAVAAYALGFAAALHDSDERVSVAVVTVLGVVAAIFAVALTVPVFSAWDVVLVAAIVAGALVSSVASFIGFRSGAPLQAKQATFAPAPLPARPRVVVLPAPVQRKEPVLSPKAPPRQETPLDELPESWRAPVFAVRLKRRQLPRAS